MVDLELVKKHMRIDDTAEDVALSLYMNTAIELVSEITAIENAEGVNFKYQMAVLLLTAHWFANREAAVAGSMQNIPYGVSVLIQNLKSGASMV